ncbi:uncharacterized protein LOC134191274 isoform X2 [Corticium candelabrum]|uniref:uncharacterized protein LOC134191274 isoform X2 n=1 Tax=Corticium candelabrum TaxID=121492 RepID=UPI002E263357|nr:uncharacterized protein LOC134191274 isoform X2 [Corticium candelabrum]
MTFSVALVYVAFTVARMCQTVTCDSVIDVFDDVYEAGTNIQDTPVFGDTWHCMECTSNETPSYLARPRIHFSGMFKSDTLTINNYYDNFDVDHFLEINEMLAKNENTGFNPTGSGDFFFEGCVVSMVCPENGPCTENDQVVGQPLQSSSGENAGKMVDLDVEVEEHAAVLYGLSIGIDLDESKPFVGRLRPAQVTDAWRSVWDIGNLTDEGQFGQASIQSVLESVEWNEDSSLLKNDSVGVGVLWQMYQKFLDGHVLSVKFNLDHYEELNASDPFFLFGRVSGTIGLTRKTEPIHFVRGRFLQSYKVLDDPENRSYANVAPFVVDFYQSIVAIDLGNALSRSTFDGSWNNEHLGNRVDIFTQNSKQVIGSVDLSSDKWYLQCAGIFEFYLSTNQLRDIQVEPIEVRSDTGLLLLSESEYLVRPLEQTFAKLNPGDSWTVNLFITSLGKSVCSFPATANITLISQKTPSDKVKYAQDALKICNGQAMVNSLTRKFMSDCSGQFAVTIEASSPGNLRGFVDGEVYKMEIDLDSLVHMHFFIRLYDAFPVPDEPTWYGSNGVKRIVMLYEMLYPFCKPSLFQSNYKDITRLQNRQLLISLLSLEESSPQSLPVARDLSSGKRKTLLKWLHNPKKGRSSD